MFEPNCPPLEAVAQEERITASYATRIVRLAFLAPDIVAAILAGNQPTSLTANKLMADTRLPLDWRDQRVALGFALPDSPSVPIQFQARGFVLLPREASTASARFLS